MGSLIRNAICSCSRRRRTKCGRCLPRRAITQTVRMNMITAIFEAICSGKLTTNLSSRDELSVTGTFQSSKWNASGEIPLRAVEAGTLGRFGAIDPSEGGNTLRSTVRLNYHYDTPIGWPVLCECLRPVLPAGPVHQLYFFSRPTRSTATAFSKPIGGSCMAEISDTSTRVNVLGMPSIGTIGFQTRVDDIHLRLGTQTTRTPTGTTVDNDVL